MAHTPWYDDTTRMREDDAHLQRAVRSLRNTLGGRARWILGNIHVYPSQTCTYTLGKRRVFVCVRDAKGDLLPDCAIKHVLLHEVAHALNRTQLGHTALFWRILDRLRGTVRQPLCPGRVQAARYSHHVHG